MNGVLVAAVQMNSQGDLEANLARAEQRVAEAAARGAKLVVLPENCAYFGEEAERARVAEDLAGDGPIARRIAATARAGGVWVVAGGIPERSTEPARPYNTCAVWDPAGRLAACYRKIHLFDVDLADGARYRESAATMPGDAPVACDVAGLKLGLSVCYDLRFPELYRRLVDLGAQAIVVPAAFTLVTGKDHWRVLLRARAIESQCWVIAAAQWGKHPRGRVTYGKSCIIDPWGEIVAQVSEGEGVAYATVDLDYLAEVRKNLPCLSHRRLTSDF